MICLRKSLARTRPGGCGSTPSAHVVSLGLYYIIICYTVVYCTALYCTVLYCIVYCTVLYCILYCVLYCTVVYPRMKPGGL